MAPKDPNPMAAGARPRLASVPLPEATTTPRTYEPSRRTTPEDDAAGDPEWLVGRMLADRAYFEVKIEALQVELEDIKEETKNLPAMRASMTVMQGKLDSVLSLIPTDREKRLALWLCGIVVSAICAKFGIDTAGAFK